MVSCAGTAENHRHGVVGVRMRCGFWGAPPVYVVYLYGTYEGREYGRGIRSYVSEGIAAY